MPFIPARNSQVSAQSELPSANAEAGGFGAIIGRATQGIGNDLQNLGAVVADKAVRDRQETAANGVANFDFSGDALKAQQEWAPDGKGYGSWYKEAYSRKVDDYANTIEDGEARRKVRMELMSRLPSGVQQANTWEYGRGAAYGEQQANNGLTVQENRVRTDASALDIAIKDSNGVIDARSDLPAAARETMKTLQSQKLVRAAFEARTEAARTTADVDGLLNDLTDPEKGWQSRMNPTQYDQAVDGLRTLKKTIGTENTAVARSAVDSLEGRNNDGRLIEQTELAEAERVVRASTDPGLARKFYDIKSTQDIYRRYPGLTSIELRAKAEQFRSGAAPGVQNVPAEQAGYINEAARLTGVPASFLAGTGKRESNWDVNAKAKTSSATGTFQITDDTWLGIVKGGGGANARLMGIDLAGKSDGQLLALRSDPRLQAIGAGINARDNALALAPVLGRMPADGELYGAHFLGAGDAQKFYAALSKNPDASAASITPKAAATNNSIFYKKNGDARTLAEVQAGFDATFATSPGRAAYVQSEALTKMADQQEKALRDDPMTYVSSLPRSNIVVPEFTPENMQAYGKSAQAVADYYKIPMTDLKPLRSEDATQLQKVIKEGSAEDVGGVMAQLRLLGPEVSKAAYKQLGETDNVFAYAAGLAQTRDAPGTAVDIIRGRKRLEADPDARTAIGADKEGLRAAFDSIVGRSLSRLDPRQANGLYEAAQAHYVETYVARGNGKQGVFNSTAFAASVNAVMGGSPSAPALGVVNGATTVLPAGVSDDQFDRALERMDTSDFTRMSADGKPPRFQDGSAALPSDIAREGKFQAVQFGEYRVQMSDGGYLMSTPGRAYIFKPDPKAIIRHAGDMSARNGFDALGNVTVPGAGD